MQSTWLFIPHLDSGGNDIGELACNTQSNALALC